MRAMKFMYCPECHDVVQMRPTTREPLREGARPLPRRPPHRRADRRLALPRAAQPRPRHREAGVCGAPRRVEPVLRDARLPQPHQRARRTVGRGGFVGAGGAADTTIRSRRVRSRGGFATAATHHRNAIAASRSALPVSLARPVGRGTKHRSDPFPSPSCVAMLKRTMRDPLRPPSWLVLVCAGLLACSNAPSRRGPIKLASPAQPSVLPIRPRK